MLIASSTIGKAGCGPGTFGKSSLFTIGIFQRVSIPRIFLPKFTPETTFAYKFRRVNEGNLFSNQLVALRMMSVDIRSFFFFLSSEFQLSVGITLYSIIKLRNKIFRDSKRKSFVHTSFFVTPSPQFPTPLLRLQRSTKRLFELHLLLLLLLPSPAPRIGLQTSFIKRDRLE